jgi:hypothetical protein
MRLILEEIENVSCQEVIEEGTGVKSMYIEGIFLQGGIVNRNKRMYPVDVLAAEVNRYNEEYVKKNRAYGELGHPNGPQINLDRISHMHKELRQEGDNFIGKAKLMDTPCGNIAKNIIREGGSLGVSSRGLGSVKQNARGVNEVQKDFRLATAADIVVDPSAPDAWVQGIMEGKSWIWDDVRNSWMEQKTEDVKEAIDASVRNYSLNSKQKFKLFENWINHLSNIENNK